METAFSWMLVAHDVAEKTIDKSVFNDNTTGLPQGVICDFFGGNVLGIRDKRNIVLHHNYVSYAAVVQMHGGGRVRLSWRQDLAHLLSKQFPIEYKAFTSDKEPSHRGTIDFQKIDDTHFELLITNGTENSISKSPSALRASDLNELPLGMQVTADDIATLSGQNRIKGIHPLLHLEPRSVVILCTLDGDSLQKKWLESDKNQLKYYLEGSKDLKTGITQYNPDIALNSSVLSSRRENYPIHVFVREKKDLPFEYEGQFRYEQIVADEADRYFVLTRTFKDHIENEPLSSFGYDGDQDTVTEGRAVVRQHVRRERDPRLIRRAIAKTKAINGKIVCEVCQFDFEQRYGERGSNFIEGHHIVPVSELDALGGETRIEDIALVCANCHRMIHHKREWLTISGLKALLR